MDRAVRRGAAQARERLAVQERLMPSPDTLLAPQRPRADDLSDRLGRGLRHRLSIARADLANRAGALRPALLQQQSRRAGERLERLRLRPDFLVRRLEEGRVALDRLSRLFVSLDPDRPLQRGFARVMADGRLVRDTAMARAAGQVTLHFADGDVDAAVGQPLEKAPTVDISVKAARKPRPADTIGQQDLFS
jgi:exodeoxyribonuclease VII large subunit